MKNVLVKICQKFLFFGMKDRAAPFEKNINFTICCFQKLSILMIPPLPPILDF